MTKLHQAGCFCQPRLDDYTSFIDERTNTRSNDKNEGFTALVQPIFEQEKDGFY